MTRTGGALTRCDLEVLQRYRWALTRYFEVRVGLLDSNLQRGGPGDLVRGAPKAPQDLMAHP